MRIGTSNVVLGLAVAALLSPTSGFAQMAPAALRGKSVVAGWTEERVQRLGDQKEFSSRSVATQLSVYISAEGRIFAKRQVFSQGRSGRMRSGDRSSVSGDAGGASSRIHGQTLTVYDKMEDGARMARISFDASFSSCQLTVVLGRSGSGSMKSRSRLSGEPVEIKSAKASGETCAIREGNVFAN